MFDGLPQNTQTLSSSYNCVQRQRKRVCIIVFLSTPSINIQRKRVCIIVFLSTPSINIQRKRVCIIVFLSTPSINIQRKRVCIIVFLSTPSINIHRFIYGTSNLVKFVQNILCIQHFNLESSTYNKYRQTEMFK